jgi:hypothetical protein
VVPGRIEGCCCGCPSFRHLEDAQAFCAGHKDSCGGITNVGCSYYPRAAQYVLLRDLTTYSEPFGTEPSGVISQTRRQDITVPVVALQGQRSTVHSGYDAMPFILWVEFMEGWVPQYVDGEKQFEPSHLVVTPPLEHEADYPFEPETSTVLLSCDIGNVGCKDTCSSAADGVCSDGSTLEFVECAFNTDCSDCGPNLPLPDCTDTCANSDGTLMVLDGICDESEGSATCDIGSDCSDCGNMQICRENNNLRNSPTVCSGPSSSICTYQCEPGYDIGGEHMCYTDGRYRGGGCAPLDTLPADMQPFVVDSEETMVCEGRTVRRGKSLSLALFHSVYSPSHALLACAPCSCCYSSRCRSRREIPASTLVCQVMTRSGHTWLVLTASTAAVRFCVACGKFTLSVLLSWHLTESICLGGMQAHASCERYRQERYLGYCASRACCCLDIYAFSLKGCNISGKLPRQPCTITMMAGAPECRRCHLLSSFFRPMFVPFWGH